MTARSPRPDDSNPQLCQIITDRILAQADRRIPFALFMELALYHPQHGYYTTNSNREGIQRDFFTSPHLGHDFGELLAIQFAEMWELLDRPRPFTLVEMGAGQGLLVADIVRYLHRHHFECFEVLEYVILEKSPGLIATQQQRLQSLTHSWDGLQWRTWAEIPTGSIVGCCFSNELVDALPVHLVQAEAGELQEVYVTIDPVAQTFQEILGPLSTRRLSDYFKLVGVDLLNDRYSTPYRTEVNLAALAWINTVADRLQQGYVLTIDYGYNADRYYSPTRSEGTLQCYSQHRHHNDPYWAIGYQDITAHVDFTALERQGQQAGLQKVDFTQQGLFLMALGLGDRLNALSSPNSDLTVQDILQRRETLHALIDPNGLGNFGVLIQSKGQENRSPLKGLTIPPLF